MTDEQIDELIQRTERNIRVQTFTLPCIGWVLVGLSTGALLWADLGGLALFFTALEMLPAVHVSQEAVRKWRGFKKAPAPRLWRGISGDPQFIADSSTEISDLKASLHTLYESDPRGEILPLSQAARLLFIYDLQQQRRHTVLQRATQIRVVSEQVMEKAAQLRELGEDDTSLLNGVGEMRRDIEGLNRLGDDILASCRRLEAIVLSVHRAVQVKQLQREIAQLKSSVATDTHKPTPIPIPELTDIERQIGREIETFLQLERETDQRLRDV